MERLHGYWINKNDPTETIFVERVYKAGYVTGFQYFDRNGNHYISMKPLKLTKEELLQKYKRK